MEFYNNRYLASETELVADKLIFIYFHELSLFVAVDDHFMNVKFTNSLDTDIVFLPILRNIVTLMRKVITLLNHHELITLQIRKMRQET